MFTLAATVVFAILALAWNKNSWLNLFIKAGLIAMTVWGVFVLYALKIVVR